MRNKKIIRLFTAMLAVVLCTTAFAVPASAGGGDGEPYYTETAEPEVTEEPQEETTGGMEPEGQPLTPEGNATLVDDFYGDKQLITVTTKAGNYFYILIDRANEDAETAVHFLNQVDEADLMALMEDGETQEDPAVCSCAEKCQAGAEPSPISSSSSPSRRPRPERTRTTMILRMRRTTSTRTNRNRKKKRRKRNEAGDLRETECCKIHRVGPGRHIQGRRLF